MPWWFIFLVAVVIDKSRRRRQSPLRPGHRSESRPHGPAHVGDCSQCHRLHGDEGDAPSPKTLFTTDDNTLCYAPGPAGATTRSRPAIRRPRKIGCRPVPSLPVTSRSTPADSACPVSSCAAAGRAARVYEDARTFGLGHYYSPAPQRYRHAAPGRPRARALPELPRPPRGAVPVRPHDEGLPGLRRTVGAHRRRPLRPLPRLPLRAGSLRHGARRTSGSQTTTIMAINPDGTAGHAIRKNPRVAISWPAARARRRPPTLLRLPRPARLPRQRRRPANGFCLNDERPGWTGLTDTRTDAAQYRRFCLGCHIPSDGVRRFAAGRGNRHEHAPAGGRASIDRDRWDAFGCHGSEYSDPTSFNVHHPKGEN